MSSLQTILEAPITADPVVETPKPTPTDPPAADATPTPTPEGTPPVETPPEGTPPVEGKTVPLSEHVKQRQRRAEAEKETQRLVEENAFLRGQQSVQQTPTPVISAEEQQALDEDFLNNPVANSQAIADKAAASAAWAAKCQVGADFMRQQHKDFDQVEREFATLARQDPALVQQLHQHPNPARFAYEYMKTQEHTSQYNSVEEMEAAMEKRIREKIEAETKKKVDDELAASTPPSQVGATGTGNLTNQPQPAMEMDAILGNPDLC